VLNMLSALIHYVCGYPTMPENPTIGTLEKHSHLILSY